MNLKVYRFKLQVFSSAIFAYCIHSNCICDLMFQIKMLRKSHSYVCIFMYTQLYTHNNNVDISVTHQMIQTWQSFNYQSPYCTSKLETKTRSTYPSGPLLLQLLKQTFRVNPNNDVTPLIFITPN